MFYLFFVSVPVWIFREYMGAVFPSLLACLVGMFMGIFTGAGEGGVQGMIVYCSTITMRIWSGGTKRT